MSESITVRIPGKLRSELKKISKQERISVSDLIRDSLQKYVAVNRFRRLRNKTLPFAEARGILTDEDVFQQIS